MPSNAPPPLTDAELAALETGCELAAFAPACNAIGYTPERAVKMLLAEVRSAREAAALVRKAARSLCSTVEFNDDVLTRHGGQLRWALLRQSDKVAALRGAIGEWWAVLGHNLTLAAPYAAKDEVERADAEADAAEQLTRRG